MEGADISKMKVSLRALLTSRVGKDSLQFTGLFAGILYSDFSIYPRKQWVQYQKNVSSKMFM